MTLEEETLQALEWTQMEVERLRSDKQLLQWQLKEIVTFTRTFYPLRWWQGKRANELAKRLARGIRSDPK